MSDMIRKMRAGLTANPNFDREGMQQALFSRLRDEPESPAPMNDYETMRYMQQQYENARLFGRRGAAHLYHPEGKAGIMPSDIRKYMQEYGDSYMNVPETPAQGGVPQ